MLVGLGILGFLVNLLADDGYQASGSSFPDAEYQLTMPKTLLDGRFELAQDASQTRGKDALRGTHDSMARNVKPAVGQYTSDSPAGTSILVFSGLYGQFKDPANIRRKMAAGAADGKDTTLVVPPRDVTPAGSGITLTCQVLTSTPEGTKITLPMCVWADQNTGASVGIVTPETSQQDPWSVDLGKMAETALKVREETRRPVG
ncbi:hypothetical protein [Streptomyces sp. NPDC059564]|uniref:hypothetical protein n=1 Tax=Streptomyces sp. NPDC059564 TaxID=3346865 RepID=UPI0036AAD91B